MGSHNIFTKGATSQLITVALRDSTTGQLKTGVAFGSVTVKYHRQGASPSTVSVVTMTAGTWTSGGWVETSDAGIYQFGVPDAALATGAEAATLKFVVSGAFDKVVPVVLIDADLRNATSLGLSRLDAAVSSRSTYAGGDTSGTTTLLSRITGTLPLASDYTSTRAAKLDNLDATITSRLASLSYTAPLDAAGTRSAVGLTSANLETLLNALAGYIDTEVGAIKAVTDKLETTIELDGVVYRFTVNALEQAPVGGGGGSTDWTSDERTAIRSILGVPTSGTTPDDPSAGILDTIRDSSVAIKADTDSLLTRIPSTLFAGITRLARWLGLIAGKTADASTLAELNATTGGTTFNNTTDSLEAIRDRGDVAWITGSGGGGGGTGTGAYALTITVNDGATVLENATVRLSSGVTTLTALTDSAGQVVFGVDAATWSLVIVKSGYAFTPTTVVVSADDSQTFSMTATAITPDPDPAKSILVVTCYDETTSVESGVEIELTQTGAPSGATNAAFDTTARVAESNGSGVVTFTIWKNAPYIIRRSGSAHRLAFTATTDVASIASFLGSP